jgi:hypothetical protein
MLVANSRISGSVFVCIFVPIFVCDFFAFGVRSVTSGWGIFSGSEHRTNATERLSERQTERFFPSQIRKRFRIWDGKMAGKLEVDFV